MRAMFVAKITKMEDEPFEIAAIMIFRNLKSRQVALLELISSFCSNL